MPEAPVILDGMRAQRGARADAAKYAQRPAVQPPAGDGTCYFSKYEAYRHQITSPMEITDPYTGRTNRDRPIVAQFVGHFFRNNHKDPKARKAIDEALQSDPKHFGLDRTFWLYDEDIKRQKERFVTSSVAEIEHNPELMAEIERRVALRLGKSEDLPIPGADVPKSGKRKD